MEMLLTAVEHRNLRGEVVRPLRAVAALERIRSSESRSLLERLAAGSRKSRAEWGGGTASPGMIPCNN